MRADQIKLGVRLLVKNLPADLEELQNQAKALMKFWQESDQVPTEKKLLFAIESAWVETKPFSKVTVVSAHPLPVSLKNALLQKIDGADLKLEVNDHLIGGAIIRADQLRIDGSVIGALSRLKQKFLAQV